MVGIVIKYSVSNKTHPYYLDENALNEWIKTGKLEIEESTQKGTKKLTITFGSNKEKQLFSQAILNSK